MINAIGWRSYVEIKCPAFTELTREFYTTFQFNTKEDITLDCPGVVKYRLMGKSFSQSITQFNIAFGFITEEIANTEAYRNSLVGYDLEFESYLVWKELSLDPSVYNPSKAEGTYLRKSVWQYMHRFLAYSFSGRKCRSVTCTKAELFFIWAMVKGNFVNLGFWLASQFQSVLSKKRDLVLGSYITHLAINLGLLDIESCNLHKACDMEPLDIKCLQRMGIVERSLENSWSFVPPGSAPCQARIMAKIREELKNTYSVEEMDGEEDDPSHTGVPRAMTKELHLIDIERRIKRMEANFAAYFRSKEFEPPFPLTP